MCRIQFENGASIIILISVDKREREGGSLTLAANTISKIIGWHSHSRQNHLLCRNLLTPPPKGWTGIAGGALTSTPTSDPRQHPQAMKWRSRSRRRRRLRCRCRQRCCHAGQRRLQTGRRPERVRRQVIRCVSACADAAKVRVHTKTEQFKKNINSTQSKQSPMPNCQSPLPRIPPIPPTQHTYHTHSAHIPMHSSPRVPDG